MPENKKESPKGPRKTRKSNQFKPDFGTVGEAVAVNKLYPVIPMRGVVVYPGSSISFEIGRNSSVQALKMAMKDNRHVILLTQKESSELEPTIPQLYKVGTLSYIRQVIETGADVYKVLAEGLERATISKIYKKEGYFSAKARPFVKGTLAEADLNDIEAMRRKALLIFEQYASLSGSVHSDVLNMARLVDDISELVDLMIVPLELRLEERQEQLELSDPKERLEKLLHLLNREVELANLGNKIDHRVRHSLDRNQREYFLREQMRKIQEELGEDEGKDIDKLRRRLEQSRMPAEYKDKVRSELDRYGRIHENSPENSVQRSWLELLLDLPYGNSQKEQLDLTRSQKILERDHYGLKKVKERILEYLAVRKLQVELGDKRVKGPILCFVGPPGVGKTSIARSIAEALGRKYIRMSLGGIHDEAEIRGHRRTYVGAMPGRIIQGIRQVGSENPLFLLDEIDKLGRDFRGDPSSALLEVLDPEQNNSFRDHYVELPYDLSQVLFITTANSAYDIPEPLLDRMELIELSGYTEEEKVEIAKRHLLPKQLKEHSLKRAQLTLRPNTLGALISGYTLEAGVRQLEREMAHLCRRVAVRIAEGETTALQIKPTDLEDILGRRKYHHDAAEQVDQVGAVTGLAWTYGGGDTMTIEVNVLPGNGKMELTGRLGSVMKESCRAALTYVRSRHADLGLEPNFSSRCDIHIHFPAGGVPKDGPSAGITVATALASALSGRAVKHEVAMTGEISLRGRVLPIGGLKEKLVAAKRANISTVLIPKENERDLDEVPDTVRQKLEIRVVDNMDQVLAAALHSTASVVTCAALGQRARRLPRRQQTKFSKITSAKE